MKIATPACALILATLQGLVMLQGAAAQQNAVSDGDNSKNLLTRPYLTPSGQVVAKPGSPQAGKQTAQQRKANEESDRVMNSICSNC